MGLFKNFNSNFELTYVVTLGRVIVLTQRILFKLAIHQRVKYIYKKDEDPGTTFDDQSLGYPLDRIPRHGRYILPAVQPQQLA